MRRPNKQVRMTAVALGIVAATVGILAGCFGPWFERVSIPKLFLGEPAIDGGQGSVLISVSNMPNGGLAGIHVDLGGLLYNEGRISSLVLEGLNGFEVLIEQFVDGEGGFILANVSGIESGPIVRLTFEAHGNVKYGDIQLLGGSITLVDDAFLLVEEWNTPAYYAW